MRFPAGECFGDLRSRSQATFRVHARLSQSPTPADSSGGGSFRGLPPWGDWRKPGLSGVIRSAGEALGGGAGSGVVRLRVPLLSCRWGRPSRTRTDVLHPVRLFSSAPFSRSCGAVFWAFLAAGFAEERGVHDLSGAVAIREAVVIGLPGPWIPDPLLFCTGAVGLLHGWEGAFVAMSVDSKGENRRKGGWGRGAEGWFAPV